MLFTTSLSAVGVFLSNSQGELIYLEADPKETIQEVLDLVDAISQCPETDREELFQGVVFEKVEKETLKPQGINRDFHAPLTAQEEKDIAYIVNTLSDQPTAKLLIHKSALDQAGDRINHVHPLNFLGFIFSHKELKVKIRNIKSKGWVWKTFTGGVKTSLNEEHQKGNLLPEYYETFVGKVGIPMNKIERYVLGALWDEMINALIKHVASESGRDRYNM